MLHTNSSLAPDIGKDRYWNRTTPFPDISLHTPSLRAPLWVPQYDGHGNLVGHHHEGWKAASSDRPADSSISPDQGIAIKSKEVVTRILSNPDFMARMSSISERASLALALDRDPTIVAANRALVIERVLEFVKKLGAGAENFLADPAHVEGLILAHIPSLADEMEVGAVTPVEPLPDSVRAEMERVSRIVTADNVYRATQARLAMGPEGVVHATPSLREARENRGRTRDDIRIIRNFTTFARRAAEWIYLRENIIPRLRERYQEIVFGNFGPGYLKFDHPNGRTLYATYEPFLLASLDPKMRVLVYNDEPEPLKLIDEFDGTLTVFLSWVPYELYPDDPEIAQMFWQAYGARWREEVRAERKAYEAFISSTSATPVRGVTWMRGHGKKAAAVATLRIPGDSLKKRITLQPRGDYVVTPVEFPPMHGAYFHPVQDYLDGDRRDRIFSLLTLIRIVDALVPEGYLFTDPRNGPTIVPNMLGSLLPYSPDANLMQTLGLEIDNDLNASPQGASAIVFRKKGSSNDFVKSMMAQGIEGLQRALQERPS